MTETIQTTSSDNPGASYKPALGGLYEGAPDLRVIILTGALAVPGTSSVGAGHIWEAPYEPEAAPTIGSANWGPMEQSIELVQGAVATGSAVSELRRISGLTWSQLAELFEVSRRSIHFWASGKPLNAANEARLLAVLDVVRTADCGNARLNRAALLEATDGVTPFSMLASQQYDQARAKLGCGADSPSRPSPGLTEEARAARKPLAPETLLDARQETIHRDIGRGRAAKTVRNKRRGRT